MCLKTTSTLVYIMARPLNASEPKCLIHPTPLCYQSLMEMADYKNQWRVMNLVKAWVGVLHGR